MSKWTINNIPDLSGKVAIVTGGNKGLGFECAKALAGKEATVVIACRSKRLGLEAISRIKKETPNAKVEVIELDLLDMKKIELFSKKFIEQYNRLDILLNNAGVVNLEKLRHNKTGREMHMATNHLGHFALTGFLLPVIKMTNAARIVTVSSGAYRYGVIDFDDFDWHKREYNRGKSYGDSKLANVLFMKELQKRFDKAGINAVSVSAHPGLTATERQQSVGIGGGFSKMIASPVEVGVLPLLRAATEQDVKPKSLFGPKYFIWGAASIQSIKGLGNDESLAEKLWDFSEKILGIKYRF
ncbi:oxidoreductase [Vallitalea okinawensis]|uniref:oxidoreductase n=1 Tax=Vallitalea okinawensis TaxID=2078660 RepID=UPI000CFC6926|nr:oxidoreductase [Vallitalea okinawensis]